jgi:hypothetical protein
MKAGIFSMIFLGFAVMPGISFKPAPDNSRIKKPKPETLSDSIPDSYFISSDFFETYSLKATKKNSHMRVWDNPDKKGFYRTVNDIRFKFDNAEKAGEDFDKNLESNSEAGRELHPGIKIPGTTHLHVFKESKAMEDRLKTFGVKDVRFYYFLFLVDNVYAKVFLTVDKSISVKGASVFAAEAAKRINAALGK